MKNSKVINQKLHTVSFKCTKDVYDYLSSLDNKSNYINDVLEQLIL
mgnify:CR=1 FL=1